MDRLRTIAPELVQLGNIISPQARLTLARRAAMWACDNTMVSAVLSAEDRSFLFNINQSDLALFRERMEKIIEYFDKKYFLEADKDNDIGFSQDALSWFGKARAAASLRYSIDAEDLNNFCEALYEAQAATNDLEALRLVLSS